MKLTEVLGELKKFDGELNKLYGKRQKILTMKRITHTDKMTLQEIKDEEAKMSTERKEKFILVEKEIERMKERIIENKLLLMKKNQELGLNEKIINVKMIRIELSKLMELVTNKSYIFSDELVDSIVDELNLNERITELEDEKRKLDAEIQAINWSNSV
jgi:hypothetical protein